MTGESQFIQKTIYQSLMTKVSNIIWLNSHWTEIFLFILAIYAALIIILWAIHNSIRKHYKNSQERFFLECDQMVAKFAQEQYNNKYENNINISLIESIIISNTKNYFLEKQTFENSIKEIEKNIWKTLIDEWQRTNFYKHYNKTKWLKIISKTIWWILTIITIWIYRIFM